MDQMYAVRWWWLGVRDRHHVSNQVPALLWPWWVAGVVNLE